MTARIALLYLGCLLAVSMELLGILDAIGRRWILTAPIIAAVVTYCLLATTGVAGWPDSSGWVAIFTALLAVGAIGGMVFAGISARHVARQTSAAVEAAYPYLRLELRSPKAIPRRTAWGGNLTVNAWWGRIVFAGGSVPARAVDVWVRDPNSFYFAAVGVILPNDRANFAAVSSPSMAEQCPFEILRDESFSDQFRVWLGLVWRCPDGSCRYNLYAIQRNGNWQGQEFMPDRFDPGFKCAKERQSGS